MNRKIMFFDIDGTIITDDGTRKIPESTITAIKKLRKNGHLAVINTGRMFMNIEQDIRNIGFDGYICGCGTYVNYEKQLLFHHTLPHDKSLLIAHALRNYKIDVLYERADSIFFDILRPAHGKILKLKEYFTKLGKDTSKTIDNNDFSFDKFIAWYDDNSDFEGFHSYITKEFDYMPRKNGFCEVVPKGFSKATGMDILMKRLNIRPSDSYAIGDSSNDLPMFKATPNSILMSGKEEYYNFASFVTRKIEDDGIEYALKHFNLI